jgi:hypothetical protein
MGRGATGDDFVDFALFPELQWPGYQVHYGPGGEGRWTTDQLDRSFRTRKQARDAAGELMRRPDVGVVVIANKHGMVELYIRPEEAESADG